jgi:O-antigen/teichoic acid export membrane protein
VNSVPPSSTDPLAKPAAKEERLDSNEVLPSLPETSNQKHLDGVLVRGVAWTASAKWLTQIATWGTTLIVARLLAPSDYGLVGMATIYLNFLTLFSEFGLGTAIITLQDLDEHQVSQLNTLSLLLGFLGFVVSAAAANLLGYFFNAPKLPMVVIAMSIGFVATGIRTVPYSLLQKEMRFKLLAVIDGLLGIIQATSTLLFAALGFGYWALVFGNLSLSLAATVLILIWRRQRFAWPRFSMIQKAVAYSWHIIAGRLSWYAYNDSDFIVAGRVLGEAPLGAYTLAWTLALAPLEKLTTLVNRVTPSVFAAIQSDFVALRRYLRNITGGLALVIFPATLGVALVAREFVLLALGPKWAGAILPLELLALHALIRSNVILLSPVLNVVGEERFAMWNSVHTLIVLPASFYLGSRWGTAGIAGVWVFVYPFLALPLFWRLFRRIQMSTKEYFDALWPAINGCILMAIAVEILKHFLYATWPLYLRFATEILVGALVYSLALILMHRERTRTFLRLFKSLRGQAA